MSSLCGTGDSPVSHTILCRRDLLTAYDGNPITYDAIGNPTTWYDRGGGDLDQRPEADDHQRHQRPCRSQLYLRFRRPAADEDRRNRIAVGSSHAKIRGADRIREITSEQERHYSEKSGVFLAVFSENILRTTVYPDHNQELFFVKICLCNIQKTQNLSIFAAGITGSEQ